MQLVGFPLLVFLCYAFAVNAMGVIRGSTLIIAGLNVPTKLVAIGGATAFIAATLLAIRKRAAAALVLGPLFILMLCTPLAILATERPPETIGDPGYIVLRSIVFLIIVAPFFYWACASSLTEGAREYFGKPQKPATWRI